MKTPNESQQLKSTLVNIAKGDVNLENYSLVQEINDPRLGHIYVMKSRLNSHFVMIKRKNLTLPIADIDDLKFRLSLKHDDVLSILDVKDTSESNEILVYFEGFISDLEHEMKKNISVNLRFSETELKNMVLSITNALKYFQSNNISHDNILPSYIFKVTKDKYKIHDNFILNDRAVLYSQAIKGKNLRYLSPELLASLPFHKSLPAVNLFKADIWSLGICLLDAGTLVSADVEYIDKKTRTVQEDKLAIRIEKFKTLYSKELSELLVSMLCINPEKRLDAQQLFRGPLLPFIKETPLPVTKVGTQEITIIVAPVIYMFLRFE